MLPAVQKAGGIDCFALFADFKMQLGNLYIPRGSGASDDIAFTDHIAFLHQNLGIVTISSNVAIGMRNQDQVPKGAHFIAHIGHNAIFRGFDQGSGDNLYVDPVIMQTIFLLAIA